MIYEVKVHFPEGIPLNAQGHTLLAFERHLRSLVELDVRVVKDLKGDDSRLRVMMTPQQREKL